MRRVRSAESAQLSGGAHFTTLLREVRRRRNLSAQEVARAMKLPLRSYQHFEGGRAKLRVDMLFRFADATGADPYGLLLAQLLPSPELASTSLDNKLVTALVLELQAFQERVGSSAATLRTTALLTAFRAMFDGLETTCAQEAAAALRLQQQLTPPSNPDIFEK